MCGLLIVAGVAALAILLALFAGLTYILGRSI